MSKNLYMKSNQKKPESSGISFFIINSNPLDHPDIELE
ncbi:hypothetical protein LEP1GSC073_3509 [Leptospira noguchii str. Cascata]|nr:hypothetical protein LEP1GSC072_0075 [Leptospira noguchii str. Bonito]EMS86045.1 hypothetical protein LEP1GSC073_3509 [Leptospira noguchii str. Cascata]